MAWKVRGKGGDCIADVGGCGKISDGDMWCDESKWDSGAWLCDPCYQRLHGSGAEPDVHEWLESQPTREEWLQRRLYDTVRPRVNAAGFALPAVRIACGWTGAGFEACTLGVCYDKAGSKAGYYEMFVSPAVEDAVTVVSIMMHEICHAIAGCDQQHNERFGDVARKLGCTQPGADGKGEWPTQAYPGKELRDALTKAAESWDPYPHAALNPPPPSTAGGGTSGGSSGREQTKQTTRLLKAMCPECGYTIRLTMKWAQRGLPTCTQDGKAFKLSTDE